MHAHRHKVFGDESNDARVRIDLGIQPSAPPSHRSGREVEQDVLVLGASPF